MELLWKCPPCYSVRVVANVQVGLDRIVEMNIMPVYAYETTIGKKGTLTLKDLLFDAGEKITIPFLG